jgi:hypothetical protein
MPTYQLLQTDEDFTLLLPLISGYVLRTKRPLWKCVMEVATTLSTSNFLTVFSRDDEGNITGYLCGNFVIIDLDLTFNFSQAFNPNGSGEGLHSFLEEELRRRGCVRIIGFVNDDLAAFMKEKYGYGRSHTLVVKPLTEGEKK